MKHARDALNEIKWREEYSLKNAIVFYIDRAKQELAQLKGNQIESWDKSFIYTEADSVIPFHRVEVVKHIDEVLYRRARISK